MSRSDLTSLCRPGFRPAHAPVGWFAHALARTTPARAGQDRRPARVPEMEIRQAPPDSAGTARVVPRHLVGRDRASR
ncbi:hypothetical protein FRAHR75_60067 [Frankia sp. Hr75.2]|nr:hypothetical protein FRAHR75_60067 [Frankia sp. Hr75.2]SQD95605.1 hypothetical protein FMEAI12_3250011 [Parafrankia sp. Ea1.12]